MTPYSLLDVLAAAGAASLSDRSRFSFRFYDRGEDIFPVLSNDQSREAISLVRRNIVDGVVPSFCMGPMDFLRGAGQQPTLGERMAHLAETVDPEAVQRYAEDEWSPPKTKGRKRRNALAVANASLRFEDGHPSDQPPALRWFADPVPRLSHPGRNLLAAVALIQTHAGAVDAAGVSAQLLTLRTQADQEPYEFRGKLEPTIFRARTWIAPLTPIGFENWRACLATPVDTLFQPQYQHHLQMFFAEPVVRGKTLGLGRSEPLRSLDHAHEIEGRSPALQPGPLLRMCEIEDLQTALDQARRDGSKRVANLSRELETAQDRARWSTAVDVRAGYAGLTPDGLLWRRPRGTLE